MTQTAQMDSAASIRRSTIWHLYLPALIEGTWALLCGALAVSNQTWHSLPVTRLALAWLAMPILTGLAMWAWIQFRRAQWQPGHVAVTMLGSIALGLVAAANSGPAPLAVWSIGLAAATMTALACYHHDLSLARWFAGLYTAICWLAGSYALAFSVEFSPALAAIFGLGAYASAHRLQRGGADASTLLYVIWGALLALLLIWRQPLAAALMVVAAFSQQSWDRRILAQGPADSTPRLPAMAGRLGWMMAMLVTALVTTGWELWP